MRGGAHWETIIKFRFKSGTFEMHIEGPIGEDREGGERQAGDKCLPFSRACYLKSLAWIDIPKGIRGDKAEGQFLEQSNG